MKLSAERDEIVAKALALRRFSNQPVAEIVECGEAANKHTKISDLQG
jgi:hypothetical protein